MSAHLGAALLLCSILTATSAAEEALPLTLERIVSRSPALAGTSPSAPAWSADGQWLGFLWNDRALPARELWVVARDGSGLHRLSPAVAETVPAVSELAWIPGRAELIYLAGGGVFRVAVSGGAPAQLAAAGGERWGLSVSPDGRRAAWLEEGDLWLLELGRGKPVRVTHVAVKSAGPPTAGVYRGREVELGISAWDLPLPPRWSPDGRYLVAQQVDRRAVRRFPIPSYQGPTATLSEVRRAAPGDVNDTRTVVLFEVATRTLRSLPFRSPERWHTVGLAWSPRGQLLVDRESDDAIDRTLTVVEPRTRALNEVWADHGEGRIYNRVAAVWHPDGRRILMTGDLDDRYRLYLLTPGDRSPRVLTSGSFDVEGAALAPPGSRWITYVSGEPRPEERQVWRMPAEGGVAERVSPLPGWNRPIVAPDGEGLALLHSDDRTPPELYFGNQRLTRSPPPEFDRVRWARVRYFQVPGTTAGVALHARVFEPEERPAGRRSPVVFGPVYADTVRNRWDGLWGPLMHLLVQRGYLVVQVDGRGSTGYGRAFREKLLMQSGDSDLDDYQDVVKAMQARPEVDPARMGIFGSSYGGRLALFAVLRRPGLFRAAVAAAPAVDPRYFGSDDKAITRTPASFPEAFERGRAVPLAGNLRDHLLIIHGMADDVVPFQTSAELAEALIRQHRDFDFAFSPTATHAWASREDDALYLYGKLIAHFDRWLGQ